MDLPEISAADVKQAETLHSRLMHWASTAHEMATDRAERMRAVNSNAYSGQRPIPADQWGTDGHDRYYDHVRVSYGTVRYEGHWYAWHADGNAYDVAFCEISVPTWFFEPGGVERFRAETDERVAELEAEERQLEDRISRMLDDLLAEHEPDSR